MPAVLPRDLLGGHRLRAGWAGQLLKPYLRVFGRLLVDLAPRTPDGQLSFRR